MKLGFILIGIMISLASKGQDDETKHSIKVFKIGNYQVALKNQFEFYALHKSSEDTLKIEICSDNLLAPFGSIRDTNELKNSQFGKYKIKNLKGAGDEAHVVQSTIIRDTNNLVYYFFATSEAAAHSYIIRGNIYDKDIRVFQTIQIGTGVEDFYPIFFRSFPKELYDKFHYVILESCVFGVQHIYHFENKKVLTIKFRCPDCVGVKRIDRY